MRRTLWKDDDLEAQGNSDVTSDAQHKRVIVDESKEANLIGSIVQGSGLPGSSTALHLPCIDIDLPCKLVESRTPGHFHLYIDKLLTWPEYAELLGVLSDLGIVEKSYASVSRSRGQTFVRPPAEATDERIKELIEG